MTDRKAIRRLLWRWGRGLDYCAAGQRGIAGFLTVVDEAAGIGPSPFGGNTRKNGAGDATSRGANRMDELISRYRGEVARLLEACDKEMAFLGAMDAVLDSLPGEQRRVIELRYKQGCRWEYIAVKMCFTVHHVQKLDCKAVDTIAESIQVEKV